MNRKEVLLTDTTSKRPIYTAASPLIISHDDKIIGRKFKHAFQSGSFLSASYDQTSNALDINIVDLDIDAITGASLQQLQGATYVAISNSGSLTSSRFINQTYADLGSTGPASPGLMFKNPMLKYFVKSDGEATEFAHIGVGENWNVNDGIYFSTFGIDPNDFAEVIPFRQLINGELSYIMFTRNGQLIATIHLISAVHTIYESDNVIYFPNVELISYSAPPDNNEYEVEFCRHITDFTTTTTGSFSVDTTQVKTITSVGIFSSSLASEINSLYFDNQYIYLSQSCANQINELNDQYKTMIFGDGSDGDVTVTYPTSIMRDMYYNNLTVTGGGLIRTNGQKIFVRDTLSIVSNLNQHCINANGQNAINPPDLQPGLGTTGGGDNSGIQTCGSGTNGGDGSHWVQLFEEEGSTNPVTNCLPTLYSNGGSGGNGGENGLHILQGSTGSITSGHRKICNFFPELLTQGFQQIHGGGGGGGGVGGHGTQPTIGGGGGGGGAGGGVIAIFANKININETTISPTISVNGGCGASATSSYSIVENGYGAGGGGGGGGGFIYITYGSLANSTGSYNLLSANGGSGGNGADGTDINLFGIGGSGGNGGTIITYNILKNSGSYVIGSNASATTNSTGTIGGICGSSLA